MNNVIRRWLGTQRFYPRDGADEASTIPVVSPELEAVRQSVRQRLQRIESKDRVFDLYAGKLRLMRDGIE